MCFRAARGGKTTLISRIRESLVFKEPGNEIDILSQLSAAVQLKI
jgi:hypothetical protein